MLTDDARLRRTIAISALRCAGEEIAALDSQRRDLAAVRDELIARLAASGMTATEVATHAGLSVRFACNIINGKGSHVG